jgi:NAD(P)-dependent dehydrogenase (short-subunit alcohol dehydrogenase family)
MRTEQKPIHSGFGEKTTATEALDGADLSGKVAIVTGGYSGIGVETTRVLSKAGAAVVVPALTMDKARANLDGIERVELKPLDLHDPHSIDAFVREFIASRRPLHMLINSAGIMAPPLTRDARGYESQFSTNHLGHFQLTLGLWPALRRAEGARVVAVSSRGHRRSGVDFDDPNFERRNYEKWAAYGQSKTANALFAIEVDRRGQRDGISAFSLHPGAIITDLARHMTEDDIKAFGIERRADGTLIVGSQSPWRFKTVPQGASTSVWCATTPKLAGRGGVYCEDCDIAEAVPADYTGTAGVSPWACDPALAERLWTLSEKLTGAGLKG